MKTRQRSHRTMIRADVSGSPDVSAAESAAIHPRQDSALPLPGEEHPSKDSRIEPLNRVDVVGRVAPRAPRIGEIACSPQEGPRRQEQFRNLSSLPRRRARSDAPYPDVHEEGWDEGGPGPRVIA